MINYMDRFYFWRDDTFFDEEIRNELMALHPIHNRTEIEDRFFRNLDFGTGGLRGIMGAGTNRINQYTVGKATKGLANYLLSIYGKNVCAERGVVIGYDTRNNSEYFSQITSNILSAMGIRVYLNAHARPVPQLSFSIKSVNAIAGVMITASHNPKEYNGYKIYDEHGCQLVPALAEQVASHINCINDYQTFSINGNSSLISIVDHTDDFVTAVLKQSRNFDYASKENLSIVYTPLHGTGYIPIYNCLKLDGFVGIRCVERQSSPDGNFSTVVSPNPENRKALEMGVALARKINADIVLGTDPDCDRVGVAVRTETGYQLITGNQIGSLLTDYILSNTDLSMVRNPAVIKTIVTSELGAIIAKEHGLSVFTTLTGFKYIGEKITQFEQASKRVKISGKNTQNHHHDYTFILGYEESYGYLVGTHARDKDAVVSSLLICEMAAYYKKINKTLIDRLEELYAKHGYYYDTLDSYVFEGREGQERIMNMMATLRSNNSPLNKTIQILDYSVPVDAEPGFGKLPAANVIKYVLDDGSWIAIRPSGTEPQIKIYYSIRGDSKSDAETKHKKLQLAIKDKLEL